MRSKVRSFKEDFGIIKALSANERIEELFQEILNVYHDVEVRLATTFYTYKETKMCCVTVCYPHKTPQKEFFLRMEKISNIGEKLGWALTQEEDKVITFEKEGIELEMTTTSTVCKIVATGRMLPETKRVCNMFLD